LPAYRDIVRRIDSIKNTQKITKAMQVVAATRLRRAQAAVLATRPYSEKMLEVLQTAGARATEYKHPFLVGRKGRDFLLRFRRNVIADSSGLPDRPSIAAVLSSIAVALEEYQKGEVDAVLLCYAKWISTLRQEPIVRTLVPAEIPEREKDAAPPADYIYEPDPESVLDALLPRYVETQVYQAVLENKASEYSAKMIAMQNATKAAGDFIESLTLFANKVRQAGITTELMEIVGGAEALRAT